MSGNHQGMLFIQLKFSDLCKAWRAGAVRQFCSSVAYLWYSFPAKIVQAR